MARDDDGRVPDSGGSPVGGDPFGAGGLVVPDDARELDADLRAYRREQRARARVDLLRRAVLWHRFGMTGPIVIGTALLVATFVSLMLLFPAPEREAARPEPLATPVRAVGEEGGLVPDLSINRYHTDDKGRRSVQKQPLRALRPSVVMLLPSACDCTARARTVARVAESHQVLVVLLGRSMPDRLPGLSDLDVLRASDPPGALEARYKVSTAPVLLVVRADGVINRILTDVPSENALDGELAVISNHPTVR